MFRSVELVAPDEPEHEGECETHGIEHPPGLRPREREDRGVQQGEIAEQEHGAAVVAHQHRGQESAGDGQARERLRIVAHGEPDRERRHRDEQRDRQRLGQHAIGSKRRVGRQVEDAGAGTLQGKAVARARSHKAHAERRQCESAARNHGEPQLDRDRESLGEVPQQEGNAEEQYDDTDARQRVAAGEPRPPAIRRRRGRRRGHRDRRPVRRRGRRSRRPVFA